MRKKQTKLRHQMQKVVWTFVARRGTVNLKMRVHTVNMSEGSGVSSVGWIIDSKLGR